MKEWFVENCRRTAGYVKKQIRRAADRECGIGDGKRLYTGGSESSLSAKVPPESLALRLSSFDVISFDVFDTLILRCVSRPADLFYLVGMTLNYPDFRKLRIWAEKKARMEKGRCGEVTLEEIWDILEEESGIDRETGMAAEWEMEKRCCSGNPYFLEVVKRLQRKGKCLAALSDMYLGGQRVRELLDRCGFEAVKYCFVSSDSGASKWEGSLYEKVKAHMGKEMSYVHVGDQLDSDFYQARRHGFAAYHYPNVNEAGAPYRPEDMSLVTGSLYRSLVNCHIHNGLCNFSREYEYGYIYGGLFVTGYCRFIHHYVRSHGIDKILFFSRDGTVLMEAYRKMYPEEKERISYAFWSRLAALKVTAAFYKHEYFQRFLYHKTGHSFTLGQVFESMELSFLLPSFCRRHKEFPDHLLTHRNVEIVKEYLMKRWDQILESYRGQREAAGLYYRELLAGCRSAAAVDVGWAGSGAVMLDRAVNHLWNLNCPITGILAGTDSARIGQGEVGETFLVSGRLVSYLYSQRENRDVWKFHDPAKEHNLYWELLLGAPWGSLQGIYPDGKGGYRCRLKENPAGAEKIRRIHQGILDFTEAYLQAERRMGRKIPISGRDACGPMLNLCRRENEKFMEELKGLMDVIHVG